MDLKKLLTNYREMILNYHKTLEGEPPLPEAFLSPAAEGNFLEVLNMSLNSFENTYLNRNLDRTGQQSIVITPGKLSITFTFTHKLASFFSLCFKIRSRNF